MTDRVVGLLYLGTSKKRHDSNLFRKLCKPLDTYGDVPPNSFDCVVYLAFRPGTHSKFIGQTRKGLINRKREHLESLAKLDRGKFNSCKMYNGPRSFRKFIFIEVISFGNDDLRSAIRGVEKATLENFGWGGFLLAEHR